MPRKDRINSQAVAGQHRLFPPGQVREWAMEQYPLNPSTWHPMMGTDDIRGDYGELADEFYGHDQEEQYMLHVRDDITQIIRDNYLRNITKPLYWWVNFVIGQLDVDPPNAKETKWIKQYIQRVLNMLGQQRRHVDSGEWKFGDIQSAPPTYHGKFFGEEPDDDGQMM